MSTGLMEQTESRAGTADGPSGASTAAGRLRALGRAELTLLVRNKAALFTALVLPVALTFMVRTVVADMDLSGTGLSVGTVLLPGSLGFVLLFAVYVNLVGTYVVRREELVLKRFRSGELSDAEVLAGAALPSVVIGLAQCVLLAAGGAAALDLSAPGSPWWLALGLLLGMPMMVAAAALTASFTASAEGAQMTPMPLLLVSFGFCGVIAPPEILPDRMAQITSALPFSPLMQLLRGGWTGLDTGEALRSVALAAAWTLVAAWFARKRFRWEPRR